jgi:hypothetical protein
LKYRYTTPDKYTDITIGMMQAYQVAKSQRKEDAMVAAMTELPIAEARKLPVSIYSTIIQQFEVLLEKEVAIDTKFIKVKQRPGIFKPKTMLGMIPDFYRITMDEEADLNTYCADGQYWVNLHKIASVLFRPVTYKVGPYYRIADYDSDHAKEFHECIKAVPIAYLNGALAFFLTTNEQLGKNSLRSFHRSLTKSLKELTSMIRGK